MNIKIVINKGNKIFEKDLNFKLKRFERIIMEEMKEPLSKYSPSSNLSNMTCHYLEKLILTVYPFQRSGTISDSLQSLYLPMAWTLTVHKSVITSLRHSILVSVGILSLRSNPDQQ